MTPRALLTLTASFLAFGLTVHAQDSAGGDWRTDAPGVVRHLTVAEMPAPYATHAHSLSVPPSWRGPRTPC